MLQTLFHTEQQVPIGRERPVFRRRGGLRLVAGSPERRHLREDSTELIYPPEVLILEGIHIFYDKRLCDMMALKVYMHVDIDVCLLRRIFRDIKSRGRTIENISEQYLATVKPMFEKYIKDYINDADFAIMRGGKNRMAIDAISAYLTTKVLAERFEKEKAEKTE